MTESLSDWLALREPADRAARSETLTERLARTLAADNPLRIVDLATGTGANARYLANRLPHPQHWLLVDRDPALLAEARDLSGIPGALEIREMDLGPIESLDVCAGCRLVTASALLDLVSEAWLQALARRCRAEGAAVLFALTYDGRSECQPPEPEDGIILRLFNEHQTRSDKGFGTAAGPAAAWCAARALTAAGYHVELTASDWRLGAGTRELQRRLVQGWAAAAAEIEPGASSTIAGWMGRRLAHIDENRSSIAVGHQDLIAYLR
jgi:SAM-dependent methyltransferase